MPNSYFKFKRFTVYQDQCAMKVTTDACLFGAWVAQKLRGERDRINRVLEAGTGTGVLSLMLAQDSDLLIDAIEIDKPAYIQAGKNVAASPWPNQVRVHHGDIRTYTFQDRFDAIVSNPPFYENELVSADQKKNVAHHSLLLSWEELIGAIKKNLKETGLFYLLVPYKRNATVRRLFTEHSLSILHLCFVRPQPGQEFSRIMIVGRMELNEPALTIIDEMTVMSENQEYSVEFMELLRDYYLAF